MPTISFQGTKIAESDKTVGLEGNQYFPRDSILVEGFLQPSPTKYTCPWKGAATYYDGVVNGSTLHDVAWSYENPKQAAVNIKGHLAFDKSQVKLL